MHKRLSLASISLFLAMLLSFIPAANHAAASSYCDWAQFVADVTVPDGKTYAAGKSFTKTWRLKNIGTCTWKTSYKLVFSSGEKMEGASSVKLPSSVAPGHTIDISVDLTAPDSNGHYRGYWKLKNASGDTFGIGSNADSSFWVDIYVGSGSSSSSSSSSGAAYDFATKACSATWTSGAGPLPCPGKDGSSKGYVLKKSSLHLEDGTTSSDSGLITGPQDKRNGYIQGTYPAFKVQSGDHFRSIVSCEYKAKGCRVTFRLDYQIGSGSTHTLWSFDENYEGSYYQADVNLSSLAGQNVKFILTVLSDGSAEDDRALWVHPIIVRNASSSASSSYVYSPSGCTDKAAYVADVSVPDGSTFAAGKSFTKTWRLKNAGTCTWTTSYQLVFSSGEQMNGSSTALPNSVAPGQTIDLSLDLEAPNTDGSYRGYWKLKNASGYTFGIGSYGTSAFWVAINVGGSSSASAYDFTANACSATWISDAGTLPCPGTDGASDGFVLKKNNPSLENGLTSYQTGLLTAPENIYNGYIQGTYPAFTVQSGDHFRSIVNCEYGASSCYVTFRLDYRIGSGPIHTFWSFREKYEGLYYQADINLSSLAGQDVKFILTVLASGSASGDRALWVGPRIER